MKHDKTTRNQDITPANSYVCWLPGQQASPDSTVVDQSGQNNDAAFGTVPSSADYFNTDPGWITTVDGANDGAVNFPLAFDFNSGQSAFISFWTKNISKTFAAACFGNARSTDTGFFIMVTTSGKMFQIRISNATDSVVYAAAVGDDLSGEIATGTAQAGAATTITLAAGDTEADNFYNGMVIRIVSGTGQGNEATITDFVNSTKIATVASWNIATPDATSVYSISDTTSDAGVFHHVVVLDSLAKTMSYWQNGVNLVSSYDFSGLAAGTTQPAGDCFVGGEYTTVRTVGGGYRDVHMHVWTGGAPTNIQEVVNKVYTNPFYKMSQTDFPVA